MFKILANNPSLEQVKTCFETLRKLLSKSSDPPVDAVIDAGLVDAIVKGLEVPDHKIQFEAAW